jgi:phytoene synthase
MQDAFSFCQARVREADKDRFLATLFAPERYRGPLFALYAFAAEIARVRDRITSPLPGEVRLQWWRDVLTGTAAGDAAGNPIAAGLLDAVGRFALPVPMLLDLIDAHTFDLYDEPMMTLAELENYAAGTSATTMRLAAGILTDGTQPGREATFRHAGIASVITAVLQRLPLHSARGQRFIPDDVLARHGATAVDVHAARATTALRSALAELRETARSHLAAVKAGDGITQRLLPAFLPVALIAPTLARMERKDADPFRPLTIPQWRRQWMLWRAARNPGRFIRVRPDGPAGSGDRG